MARIHDVLALCGSTTTTSKEGEEERKRIMGIIARHELLLPPLRTSGFPLEASLARRLVFAGSVPAARIAPVVACWRCQLPITNWETETDDPRAIHRHSSPSCDHVYTIRCDFRRHCNIL